MIFAERLAGPMVQTIFEWRKAMTLRVYAMQELFRARKLEGCETGVTVFVGSDWGAFMRRTSDTPIRRPTKLRSCLPQGLRRMRCQQVWG